MSAPRPDVFDLGGRLALVTGAASGIGRATAAVLAGAGATVLCADVDEEGARRCAADIAEAGGRAEARRVDVSESGALDAVVADALASHGRLDVMANVAGIITQAPVLELEDDALARVLEINLYGVVRGCRAAGRAMLAQGSGSIVNMASAAVDAPAPGLAAYGMAKAAVVQLTRVLAAELGPSGVRVNAVAPGFVETAMTARHYTAADGSVDEGHRKGMHDAVARGTPLRTVGQPDDIAYAVLYLASDAARFVTGQILRPNGGVAMPW